MPKRLRSQAVFFVLCEVAQKSRLSGSQRVNQPESRSSPHCVRTIQPVWLAVLAG